MSTEQPIDVLGAEDDSDDESNSPRDDCERKYGYTYGEVLLIFGWIISFILLGIYLWSIITGYVYLQSHPPVSVDVVSFPSLKYPKTTFCSSIPDTRLSFVSCFVPGKDCSVLLQPKKIRAVLAGAVYTYQCYVFNHDGTSTYKANDKGYGGSISFQFKIDDFASIFGIKRTGLFVFFNDYDEGVSVDNDHAKFNFASVGEDNFFTLSLEHVNRLQQSVEYRTENVLYKAVKSSVKLVNYDDGTIVVSLGYGRLDVTTRTEYYSKTWTFIMGEIAGMLGVLFGLDLMKMIKIGFVMIEAYKKQKLRLVFDAIN